MHMVQSLVLAHSTRRLSHAPSSFKATKYCPTACCFGFVGSNFEFYKVLKPGEHKTCTNPNYSLYPIFCYARIIWLKFLALHFQIITDFIHLTFQISYSSIDNVISSLLPLFLPFSLPSLLLGKPSTPEPSNVKWLATEIYYAYY